MRRGGEIIRGTIRAAVLFSNGETPCLRLIFPQAKIEEMSPESWDDVMNTNLKGTFLGVKAESAA